jgi:hypothetical protein
MGTEHNGRNDQIDVEQIDRNILTTEDSTLESPWNEEVMSGDADWGPQLFNQMPEDRVGFMTNGRNRRDRR